MIPSWVNPTTLVLNSFEHGEICVLMRLLIPPVVFKLGWSEIPSEGMDTAVVFTPHRESVPLA
jgi:hypothetical protein